MRNRETRNRSEPFDVLVAAEELFTVNEIGNKILMKSLPQNWTWNGDSIFLASSVNLKTMTPDQRAMFIADKRRELEDFFENKVWEFDVESNANPERTMKAKWILK